MLTNKRTQALGPAEACPKAKGQNVAHFREGYLNREGCNLKEASMQERETVKRQLRSVSGHEDSDPWTQNWGLETVNL